MLEYWNVLEHFRMNLGCFWMSFDVLGSMGNFWDISGHYGTFCEVLGRLWMFWGRFVTFWEVL